MNTPTLPAIRSSAHMQTIAFVLRQAARFEEDPENRSVYQTAADDLAEAAENVAKTEEMLARAANRIVELERQLAALTADAARDGWEAE